MKKIVSLFLTLALVIGIVPVTNIPIAFAEDAAVTATSQDSSELWDWATYGDGVQLTNYKGSQTDVYVPNKVEKDGAEYSVLKLGDNLFKDNTAINSVTLGEGITEIGASAFSGATNLVCIVTNQTLITIGDSAFSGCSVFNSIILYDTVTSIGEDAFAGCDKLTIYCGENSAASIYAIENNIELVFINAEAVPETYTVDGVKYYIINGEAIAVSFDNSVKSVVIPAMVQNYPVTDINDVFKNSNITGIMLPNTLKNIEEYAFSGCTLLKSITIPDSITSIGVCAFEDCRYLTSIIIPDSITTISHGTFWGCTSLTSITIPDSVTSISTYAFTSCTSLTSITIPDSVTSIGSHAFWCCEGLKSITIPDSVTSISRGTFISCTSLTSITLPNSVTSIGDYAFWCCKKLASITIPDSVVFIDDNAFEDCTSLTSITLPNSVSSVGSNTFDGCTSLKSINISNSVNSVSSYMFSGCTSLTNITIPDSVDYIDNYAFRNCTSLTSINIPRSVAYISTTAFPSATVLGVYEYSYAQTFAAENNLSYSIITESEASDTITLDGITYLITNGKATAVSFDNSVQDITIPSSIEGYSVTRIGSIFKNSNITSVTIPDSVTAIGYQTFYGCASLSSVTIPDSVTAISNYAFYNCTSLKSITIPDSVTSIGKRAFNGCKSLENVKMSDSVTAIDDYAFGGCTSLKSITIPNSVISIGDTTFGYCTNLTDITIPDSVTSIDNYAFYNCTSLKSVTVPDSVTNMGINVFGDCTGLRNANIQAINSISNHTFDGCTNLTSVTMPFASSIGYKTFCDCTSLRSIIIPDSVTSIGTAAFADCISLTSITIPDSVTSIHNLAFSGCTSLTSVKLSNSITAIKSETFKGCTSLKNVTIPNLVTSIEYAAFENCTNLTRVVIPDSVTFIKDLAFYGCTSLTYVTIPKSVTFMAKSSLASFPSTTILCVYENSYAHTFAVENNLLYFILRETSNPEIAYGAGITGTATYTDGTAVSGAAVEILYDDGTVKESVTTDETGAYSFTYAEVGRYTIRVTDASGNTGSEVVSVKRMNVFDVFLAGETDVVIKKGYTVSGTVSPTNSTITLTDPDGNVIASAETTDGTYSIENIPNGTYTLKAETENGTAVREVTVYNGDVTVETITVASESATVTGYVEVEDREFKHHKRNWVHITIYNEDGVAVASQKSDKDGNYSFTNLPLGEYSIVAETNEMRPDKHKHFDRSHKLTGYAYVNVTEAKTYTDVNIVLYEENDHTATISGKVTAKGETQDCEVILTNVFKHEIAKCETGKNGKYTFKNIPDGLYFITAITKSDGMGFAVVIVHNGKVYGDTDITISKPQKFYDRETKMHNDIPHCNNREDALNHRERIAEEKRYYDGLSPKEKKHFSKEYVERLNRLCEWIADSSYTSTGDVKGTIENEGTIISGDELDAEEKIEFVLNISETSEHTIPDDGIKTREEFEQQSIKDIAGDKHIAKYYDISLSKNGKSISNVHKHTDTTGKLRITMEIPEEYRGHKHYSFVHMHNGEPTTLVDLDDDPNTVTFEIDKFSTFALTYSDIELTETSEYPATITYDETTGKITVSSSQAGMLYIATFDGDRFVSVETDSVYAETPKEYDFKANQAAFVWDGMTPLSKKFTINN